ncbi:unnamed protein product [Adineta steineri]|uniref:Uncharacterized protein n=1 Tax=Adineta steineri TaxID=433720 RepID=A0A815B3N0_9BILA|nr:unnamed protein product [Adineta steineri]
MQKLSSTSFVLIGFVLIFIFGVFIGLNLNTTDIKPLVAYLSSNAILQKNLESNQQQSLHSFSFAYNTTHLWSMRLADENYYRIVRRLPCRTVNYIDHSINETMNHCSQTTINEFSVKETVNAQKWFYEHQHPVDCSNKKFAVIHNHAWSGIGSTIHQVAWAFGEALAQNRIAVYETPGNWVYGDCKFGTLDCFFLPITNCSIPSKIDGNQTNRIPANKGHWEKARYPDVFQNRTLTWYRSQLLFYLMRYNAQTLAHVQHLVAQSFDPPSVDLHHPYIALYVRRSDKVTGGILILVMNCFNDEGITMTESVYHNLYKCAKSILSPNVELPNYTLPVYIRSYDECVDKQLFDQYSFEVIHSNMSAVDFKFYGQLKNNEMELQEFSEKQTEFIRCATDSVLRGALESTGKRSKEDIDQLSNQFWKLYKEHVKQNPDDFDIKCYQTYVVLKKL